MESIVSGVPTSGHIVQTFRRQLHGHDNIHYQQARSHAQRTALRKAWVERELNKLQTSKQHQRSRKEIDDTIGTYMPLEKVAEAYGHSVNPNKDITKAM